jgi:hypothetical protein
MDQDMKDSGKMERLKDMEDLWTQKESFMKVILLKIKLTVLESRHFKTKIYTQEIGKMEKRTDKELKNGQTEVNT